MSEGSIQKINGNFTNKDILSLSQFDKDSMDLLFSHISHMRYLAKNFLPTDILKGNIGTLLFYEPSSRTRASFDAAFKQLGGQTVVVENPQQFSSVSKGETFEDTIRVFESYCDVIVLRHPEKGTAKKAAITAKFVPIINAGDGPGEHPTQALLDLYTIFKHAGRLTNLVGVCGGDIKNGRTIHSLLKGLSLYEGNTVYLLSPNLLKLEKDDLKNYKEKGLKIIEIDSMDKIPKEADFWYWTRVQKERFDIFLGSALFSGMGFAFLPIVMAIRNDNIKYLYWGVLIFSIWAIMALPLVTFLLKARFPEVFGPLLIY